MNRLHDFSLLSSNSFLHPFLKSKFTKKNSLIPKKFHFRRPIFNKHHDINKAIYYDGQDEWAKWLVLWASELNRVSSIPPHDTLSYFS